MNNQPIGVIDTGFGGLTVLQKLHELLPQETFYYMADSLHCPYGNREASEIHVLARKLVKFLLKKKIKLLVVACNAITVTCIDELRKEFPNLPIVGTVPVIKQASEQTKKGVIGVLTTKRTAQSTYLRDLIHRFAKDKKVVIVGTDGLVPLVEEGIVSGEKVKRVLKSDSRAFKRVSTDVVALACTHFPFLRMALEEELGVEVTLLDPAAAVARRTKVILINNKIEAQKKAKDIFFTTGSVKAFQKIGKKLLGKSLSQVEKAVI